MVHGTITYSLIGFFPSTYYSIKKYNHSHKKQTNKPNFSLTGWDRNLWIQQFCTAWETACFHTWLMLSDKELLQSCTEMDQLHYQTQ